MKEFDKIIGYASIKKELEQISDVLKSKEAYEKLGVISPKGLLLHGEPGVGKTLMATALIEASGRKVFTCRKNQPNGDFVKTIKETFTKAAQETPSIVFLDDMDKFANGDERHRDAEEYVTVQSCIDELKGKEVFVLATANNTRTLPYSLLRAGRFDRIIRVKNPHGDDAVKIINHYLKHKKFMGNVDPIIIAKIMDRHSCAELETVINQAGLYAGFERSDVISMNHFMKAYLHTIHDVPNEFLDGCSKKNKIDLSDGNSLTSQVIYHEAGHAALSEILDPESVTLISAYSRRGEFGGFTTCYRSNTATPMQQRKNHIVIALGGIAALEQKFGIMETGTSDDLAQAFKAVWDCITENCICGFHLHSNHSCGFSDSDDLKAKQELAASLEVERYYQKAKEILTVNHAFLEEIAQALAQKSVLTALDIKEIKSNCHIIPMSA